jgi:hypothetical protein
MPFPIAFVSVVAVALLMMWLARRSATSAAGTAGIPNDPDDQILKQLSAAGSDLSKAHPVELFLYFPDETRAAAALEALTVEGYTGRVERAAMGPGWLCFATKQVVPSHAAMVAIRDRMTALALAGDGEYDGWGTPVVG